MQPFVLASNSAAIDDQRQRDAERRHAQRRCRFEANRAAADGHPTGLGACHGTTLVIHVPKRKRVSARPSVAHLPFATSTTGRVIRGRRTTPRLASRAPSRCATHPGFRLAPRFCGSSDRAGNCLRRVRWFLEDALSVAVDRFADGLADEAGGRWRGAGPSVFRRGVRPQAPESVMRPSMIVATRSA
jgi:hypothetical protein